MNNQQPYNDMPLLPLEQDFETIEILKALNKATRALGRLRGIDALTDTKVSNLVLEPLLVPESVSSNEIEGIHTTTKAFFDAEVDKKKMVGNNKEIQSYRDALLRGFNHIQDREALIVNDIIKIQEILEPNKPGIQSSPGKQIMNSLTKEVLYIPPQGQDLVLSLMSNLEKYINDDTLDDIDPLIKMAIIHYQFESIHPFLDGNGRTGRIIMILYLVLKDLLDFPILYLSGYINKHKGDYYRLLHDIREKNAWEEYIIYMLTAIEEQAKHTTQQLVDIDTLIRQTKEKVKSVDGIRYSEEFVISLFHSHSFTITGIADEANMHRNSIKKYCDLLEYEKVITPLSTKKNYKSRSVSGFREILQRV